MALRFHRIRGVRSSQPWLLTTAMLAGNKELGGKIEELQNHLTKHDASIQEIVRLIKRLMEPPPTRRSKIGFALPLARTRLVAT